MIASKSFYKTILNTETTVFVHTGLAAPVAVLLENRDPTQFIQYQVYSSTDGVTYVAVQETTDTSKMSGILAPGNQVVAVVRTVYPYLKLSATCPGSGTLEGHVATFAPSTAINFQPGAY